ncbi:MAG: hypothetical protein HY887_01885, partial [Deltaproteobacteria bacterium]|nr:hypothetical protein [Deltaproteobacteria bacterium]
LKREGLNNQKIAKILTANVYGVLKRKTIAKEWAEALGVSKKEFLKFIGID